MRLPVLRSLVSRDCVELFFQSIMLKIFLYMGKVGIQLKELMKLTRLLNMMGIFLLEKYLKAVMVL